tara:strand:- start:457 stop:630 length:174 start_codon:yes stop_codon:yes gene_type:complete
MVTGYEECPTKEEQRELRKEIDTYLIGLSMSLKLYYERYNKNLWRYVIHYLKKNQII